MTLYQGILLLLVADMTPPSNPKFFSSMLLTSTFNSVIVGQRKMEMQKLIEVKKRNPIPPGFDLLD